MRFDVAAGGLAAPGVCGLLAVRESLVPGREVGSVFGHGAMIDTKTVLLQAPFRSLYRNGDRASNNPMKSNKENRRLRLAELIATKFDNEPQVLAKALGFESPSLIYAYRNGKKNIGDKMARRMELASHVARFYLDAAPEDEPALGGLESQLMWLFQRLSNNGKESVLGRAQALFAREHPDARSVGRQFSDTRHRVVKKGKAAPVHKKKGNGRDDHTH